MMNELHELTAIRQESKNKEKELSVQKIKKSKRRPIDGEVVVSEILSRLPVKSLMRFKCVCKHWKLTIEQDSHFINLHLAHSETRPSLFVVLRRKAISEGTRNYKSFISADLRFDGKPADAHTIRETTTQILGPIVGLVCFFDICQCAVQIYNVSTREQTPWMKSTMCMNIEKKNAPRCYFGFDPTTKKHKAILVWCKGKFLDFPVCEVLTVGDNTWRTLDEEFPYNRCISYTPHYASGSIYWLLGCRTYSIRAFDIGSEKFRVIPAPELTEVSSDGKAPEFEFYALSEVDGCLAVIFRDKHIVKMWILRDKENVTSSITSTEKDWTQVTITLPSNRPEGWSSFVYFHSVAGIHQIILETYEHPRKNCEFIRDVRLAKFYSYDRKEKTFNKFEVNGISFFPAEYGETDGEAECITTFAESLWPIQKKMLHQ